MEMSEGKLGTTITRLHALCNLGLLSCTQRDCSHPPRSLGSRIDPDLKTEVRAGLQLPPRPGPPLSGVPCLGQGDMGLTQGSGSLSRPTSPGFQKEQN